MAHDRQRIERYAMQAEQMSKELKIPGAGVRVEEVGEALGLTEGQSREVALYLQQKGWASVSRNNVWWLNLTDLGFEEIPKLRWSFWRRWMNANLALIGVIIGTVALILSLINSIAHWR